MSNPNKAEIIMIVDKSSSMFPKRQESISGFNVFIEEQKKLPGEAFLTLCLFDTKYEIVKNGVPLKDVQPWTTDDYNPSGYTALLDAVGRTIDETGKRLSDLKEEDRPGVVIVCVLTDGEENSSREYNRATVQEKIKHQTGKYGWQFIYLGNNPDTLADKQQAVNLGFARTMVSSLGARAGAVSQSYGNVARSVTSARMGKTIKSLDDQD